MSVTNYTRFKLHTVFGLVATGSSIAFIARQKKLRQYVAVTACQLVVVWDLVKQIKAATLECPEETGTARVLCARPLSEGSNTHLAVGYSTGNIAIFSVAGTHETQPEVFHGHRGAISTLTWDKGGMRLASGGVDGEIVLFDVVAQRGLVRLKAHKGVVTKVLFMESRDVLVSSGRDGSVKFWDIPSAHCFRTLAALTAQVWDIALVKNDTRLIIGGDDAVLHVWSLNFKEHHNDKDEKDSEKASGPPASEDRESKFLCLDTEGEKQQEEEFVAPVLPGTEDDTKLPDDDASILSLENIGRLQRSKVGRVMGMQCAGSVLACYGQHGALDLFKVLNEEEVHERIRRRLKRTRKRLRATEGESGVECEEESSLMSDEPQLADEMRTVASLPVHHRLSGISAVQEQQNVYVATLYNNNSLAVVKWDSEAPVPSASSKDSEELDKSTVCLLSSEGHRAEVRCAQFSSIGDTLVTLSNEALKLWTRSPQQNMCKQTVPLTTHVRTMLLAPGDRHVVLGTSSGHLQLLDLTTGDIVEDIAAAHTAKGGTSTGLCEVTALALTADSKGLMSGGSDQNVRYWKFELVSDESLGRRLSLQKTEDAVSANDGITCIHCSSDGRLIAVATLDNKETLYYADTMKLHHELYGKSLPTTAMSFTSDGDILVTGGKDATIMIYGTDFGDRRRLIKDAHTGGVTCIQFEGNKHLFFSAGHDGLIKYWDADTFQRIMTLTGHAGIVRCLSVSTKGNWLATAGQDQSIRLWERTEELLELSEEREMERRKQEEEEAADEQLLAGQTRHVEGESGDAVAVRAGKPTYRTDDAIDMILAGIQMCQQTMRDPEGPKHYLLLTYGLSDPLECFLGVLHRIRPSEVEEAIIQLELSDVVCVLGLLCRLGKERRLTEVAVRVATVAIRTHHTQISASRETLPLIRLIDQHMETFCTELTDSTGLILAAHRHAVDRQSKKKETIMYADALERLSKRNMRRKKKEGATKRAMLAFR